MVESYKTIYKGCSGEIVMKKSRFIANILPVESEEEAAAFIDERKKKYWDAAHNCTAYVIGTENPIMHCSDDGEPSKTAGRPMLDVLLNHGLTNLVLVVTRYFGGTLLGTGGLVKAYQSATIEGLNQGHIITKTLGYKMELTTDYNFVGKIQYYVAQESIPTLSSDYTDIVQLTLIIPISFRDEFEKNIAEITNGQGELEEQGTIYYAIINNKIQVYENN